MISRLLILVFLASGISLSAQRYYGPGSSLQTVVKDDQGATFRVTLKHNSQYSVDEYGAMVFTDLYLEVIKVEFLYVQYRGQRFTKSQIQSAIDRNNLTITNTGKRYIFNPSKAFQFDLKLEGATIINGQGSSLCSESSNFSIRVLKRTEESSVRAFDRKGGSSEIGDCIRKVGNNVNYDLAFTGLSQDFINGESKSVWNPVVLQYLNAPTSSNTSQGSRRYSSSYDEFDGLFLLGTSLNFYQLDRTPGLDYDEGVSFSIYASLEHTFYLDDDRNFGLHLGANGQQDFIGDVEQGDQTIFSDRSELGFFGGITLFEYVEVDYFFRGLELSGTVTGEDPVFSSTYSEDLGGGMKFQGGLRSSVYIKKGVDSDNDRLFARLTFEWVDGRNNSPISFLSLNQSEVATQSMCLRAEAGNEGILVYLFYASDSYINPDAIAMGMDSFGFGLNFNVLW